MMHDLILICISLLIGQILGYRLCKATTEMLTQDRLLELKKYEVDKQYAFQEKLIAEAEKHE